MGEDKTVHASVKAKLEARNDIFKLLAPENPMLRAAESMIMADVYLDLYNEAVMELHTLGFNQFPIADEIMGHTDTEHGGRCSFTVRDILDTLSEGPVPVSTYSLEGELNRRKTTKVEIRKEKSKTNLAASLRRRLGYEPPEWRCVYCLKYGTDSKGPDERSWHVDHMYPQIHGGDNKIDNKVLSCATCNSKKGSKTVIEYIKLISGGANVQ